MDKNFILLVGITILAGISTGIIVTSSDPFESGEGVKIFFFLSLFAFLWGAGTLAFFLVNIINRDRWPDSFRRGMFLSFLLLILIFLRRNDITVWYGFAAFSGFAIAVEIWLYKKLSRNVDYIERPWE